MPATSVPETAAQEPPGAQVRPRACALTLLGLVLLLALVLGNSLTVAVEPLFDEPDMSTTVWQACRVLDGQRPFVDYTPIYGPGQQYATAGFLALLGPNLYAGRACALAFALATAVLAYLVARGLALSVAASVFAGACTLSLLAGELTPQGSVMVAAPAMLCAWFIIEVWQPGGGPAWRPELLAFLAGLGIGFATGTKPNVGVALACGTAAGLWWPVCGRGWRIALAILCSWPALVALCGTLPFASTVPFVAAPVLLVVWAGLGAGLPSPRPPLREAQGRAPLSRGRGDGGEGRSMQPLRSATVLLAGAAFLSTCLVLNSALTPDGFRGFLEWGHRLRIHANAALPTALLWPGDLWAKTLALFAVAGALVLAARRFLRLSTLGAIGLAGAAIGALSTLYLAFSGFSVMRAISLWAPAVVVAPFVQAALRGRREPRLGHEPSPGAQSLLPLSVALLIAGAQGFDYNNFALPCLLGMALLAALPLPRGRAGSPAVLVAFELTIIVAYIVVATGSVALRSSIYWVGRRAPALVQQVYRILREDQRDVHYSYAMRFKPFAMEAWLPDDVTRAMDLASAGNGEVYCVPFPLMPLLREGATNASSLDYWASVYVTPEEVTRDLRRLDAGSCDWVMLRRWRLSFGPWREIRKHYVEDQTLSAHDRVQRDYPQVIRYLERSGTWRAVLRDPEVELWHRDRGGAERSRLRDGSLSQPHPRSQAAPATTPSPLAERANGPEPVEGPGGEVDGAPGRSGDEGMTLGHGARR